MIAHLEIFVLNLSEKGLYWNQSLNFVMMQHNGENWTRKYWSIFKQQNSVLSFQLFAYIFIFTSEEKPYQYTFYW